MGRHKALVAGLVQPPWRLPQRGTGYGKVSIRLPEAELLRSAGVAGCVAEAKALQGHVASFRKQPIGALPIHRSAWAALGLSGNGDFGDDTLRCLHPKWSRRIGVTRHVGPIASIETGGAENLLPLPD